VTAVPDPAIALDLTWAELDRHVGVLAQQIRQDGVPHVIVGILRGGMIPAVSLAHQLGVRDVRGVEVTRTLSEVPNGEKTPQPRVINPASLGTIDSGADVLLVDDVAGSGDTAAAAANLLSDLGTARLRRAVLVVNTVNWTIRNAVAPHHVQDYIGTTCTGWVRFPWEAR
jgi:hypoxanthine phosphoribosyltransferase